MSRPTPSVPALIAGGYAGHGAAGIYPLSWHGDGLAPGDPLAPVRNVSAGVCGGARWYVVDEEACEVVVLDADWRILARVPSGGAAPCHLALDEVGTRLAVANYGDGTTASFRLGRDGLPCAPPSVHRHEGSGPDPERQAGPHTHWVGFAPNGLLYATDLGADRVLAFPAEALGEPRLAYAAPPGSGPRQLAFHPGGEQAYLVSELASTLTVLRVAPDGTLVARRIVSTLPPDWTGESLGGAIVLHGDRLYVGNRGHDSIATFAVDDAGDVRLLGHQPSGGASPRFLLVHRGCLLVAHEEGGGVTVLPLDHQRRPGPPVARATVPGAAFLGDLS